MEAGFIILTITAMMVGMVVGTIIGRGRAKCRYERDTQYTQGILNVDCSDPEFQPGLYLVQSVPVEEIANREYAMFKVNVFR